MNDGVDEHGGGTDPSGRSELKSDATSNVRFFPGVGSIDELIPMGSAAREPGVADGDGADGGAIHVFPGVGPIDELVPMGSAVRAPAAADDEFTGDSAVAGNVRVFPGVGPIDELIPMSPPEKAPVAATMNADAFWGEDAQFLHQAIAAPRATAHQPLTAPGPNPVGGGKARIGSGLGRWFAPALLVFLCLAGLALAVDHVGVSGRPGAVPHAGARPATRADASRRRADARSYPATRVPSIRSLSQGSVTSRTHHRLTAARHGSSKATTTRTTPVKHPLSTSGSGATVGTTSPPKTTPVATTPVRTAPADTTPVETTPVETTPAAPASSPPAGATASSGSTSAGSGSTAATQKPTGSSGGKVVSHSGGSDTGGGAGDIGAGRGLPGPSGPPPP